MSGAIKFHNIQEWIDAGYDGEGINFLELEGDTYHCKSVIDNFLAGGMKSKVYNMKVKYKISGNEIIYDNLDEIKQLCIKNNIKIIGCSKAMNYQQVLIDKFRDMLDELNLIFVTSAGNDGMKGITGDIKKQLAINAVQIIYSGSNKIMRMQRSSIDEENDFSVFSENGAGTSFAQPILSKIIAIICSRYGNLNQSEIYELLKSISMDLGEENFDKYYGWGSPVLPDVKEGIEMLEIKTIKFKHNPTLNNRITYQFGLTEAYGPEFHNGIDLGAITPGVPGDNIYAVDDGVVIMTKENSKDAGKYIILRHKNYFSRYCHLKRIKIDVGENIKAGDIIGLMGNTGKSTAAHLHLEVKIGDYKDFWDKDKTGKYINAIDPEPLLVKEEDMFKDIEPGRWSEKDIELCSDKGILKGFSDGTFRPEEKLTREQAAVIAARLIRLEEKL